jgi:hypothetical protein
MMWWSWPVRMRTSSVLLVVLLVGLAYGTVDLLWSDADGSHANAQSDALPQSAISPAWSLSLPLAPATGVNPVQSVAPAELDTAVLSRSLWQDLMDRSRFDLVWLNSHGFAVGSPALKRLHGLLDGRVSLPDAGKQPIAFAPQGGTSGLQAGEIPVFSSNERYISASLRPEVKLGDAVILRWRNTSDNTVIELSAQATPTSAGNVVPLWKYSVDGWPPGRYRVEVISPDASLTLLAAGDFEISAPGAPVTPFAFSAFTAVPQ